MKNLVILVLLFMVTACQSKAVTVEVVSVENGSYRNIGPKELATILKNMDFVFINVHIPFSGNIADTDLSIPCDEIEQNAFQLPHDKNAKIVLYCRSGRMSEIAAEKLISLGTQTFGILKAAWWSGNRPVTKLRNKVTNGLRHSMSSISCRESTYRHRLATHVFLLNHKSLYCYRRKRCLKSLCLC